MSASTTWLLLVALCLISQHSASAKIISQCDAAKALARAGVERTFISNFVCVMKSESNFNTALKKGPGHKASYSYGVFQISSDKWCSAFRPGGVCGKKCDAFLDDDISDDIACAKIIFQREGFKHWNGWVKSCKKGDLPNVSGCMIRRDVSAVLADDEQEELQGDIVEDEEQQEEDVNEDEVASIIESQGRLGENSNLLNLLSPKGGEDEELLEHTDEDEVARIFKAHSNSNVQNEILRAEDTKYASDEE